MSKTISTNHARFFSCLLIFGIGGLPALAQATQGVSTEVATTSSDSAQTGADARVAPCRGRPTGQSRVALRSTS